jgi:hypothetical protein
MRSAFLSFLTLAFLASFHPGSSHNPSLKRQAAILISLKQAFESFDPSLNSWNASNYLSLCSWTGVLCDSMNGLVVSLDISYSNISGSLSPALTELRALVNLSIAGNSFSGSFPPDIHKLERLQFLNISINMFSGDLNWEFSLLKELVVLDAYDNNFNASLPLGITQLPELQHLRP